MKAEVYDCNLKTTATPNLPPTTDDVYSAAEPCGTRTCHRCCRPIHASANCQKMREDPCQDDTIPVYDETAAAAPQAPQAAACFCRVSLASQRPRRPGAPRPETRPRSGSNSKASLFLNRRPADRWKGSILQQGATRADYRGVGLC